MIFIDVTLDTSKVPHLLDVHDHGGISVKKNLKPQTIRWKLAGNLKDGAFEPMREPEPGFEWVGTPPPKGLFDDPEIAPNGGSLDLVDHHTKDTGKGQWTYRLRVRLGDTVYETTALPSPGSTVNNPIIINP